MLARKEMKLTEGPLFRQIVLFSLPLVLSNLLQVLFNMSDIAVVGQFAGARALGAVGSTAILVSLFTGFLIIWYVLILEGIEKRFIHSAEFFITQIILCTHCSIHSYTIVGLPKGSKIVYQ